MTLIKRLGRYFSLAYEVLDLSKAHVGMIGQDHMMPLALTPQSLSLRAALLVDLVDSEPDLFLDRTSGLVDCVDELLMLAFQPIGG